MDLNTLALPFALSRTPDWICPTCSKGNLCVVERTFNKGEPLHSRDKSHPAWEPEWIRFLYSCLLECSNENCKELVANSGTGEVRDGSYFHEDSGEYCENYNEWFRPTFFEPALKIIKIPADCHVSIADPLEESFKLFFASPSAAANCIRIAVEALLTFLKIRRFTVVKEKRKPTNLHHRIEMLPTKYAHVKEMIFAIKWIGNAGSHTISEINLDDVIVAYQLIDHTLNEVYLPKAKLTALAKKVNRKKGPIAPNLHGRLKKQ